MAEPGDSVVEGFVTKTQRACQEALSNAVLDSLKCEVEVEMRCRFISQKSKSSQHLPEELGSIIVQMSDDTVRVPTLEKALFSVTTGESIRQECSFLFLSHSSLLNSLCYLQRMTLVS